MGEHLCSMNIFDIDDHQKEEEKIIKKRDKKINEEIPETIQENISMYSNTDIPEKNNNKYCRNYDDINNLKSSIFDNEENDHIKKYEQEINTEEHPYLFNYNSNISKNIHIYLIIIRIFLNQTKIKIIILKIILLKIQIL